MEGRSRQEAQDRLMADRAAFETELGDRLKAERTAFEMGLELGTPPQNCPESLLSKLKSGQDQQQPTSTHRGPFCSLTDGMLSCAGESQAARESGKLKEQAARESGKLQDQVEKLLQQQCGNPLATRP